MFFILRADWQVFPSCPSGNRAAFDVRIRRARAGSPTYCWDETARLEIGLGIGLGNGANCISARREPAYALAIKTIIRMATNMVPPQFFAVASQCQRLVSGR